jgi:hypothetical protein
MSIFSCKDTVRLASESLDHNLSLGRRPALHFHLLLCANCARFHRYLRFLEAAAHGLPDQAAQDDAGHARLSAESRERMERAIEQQNT